MDVNSRDEDYEWATLLVHHACLAVLKYEDHLRSKDSINEAKALAKAMRELKEMVPNEILEVMRG
jgi:hypothetical protein